MPPTKDTPSVLAAGFELIKQYPGEEQVRLKVVVEIPGSWFGSGAGVMRHLDATPLASSCILHLDASCFLASNCIGI